MEIEELVEIVETMAIEHSYPGYDIRCLPLGLPDAVTRSPSRLFSKALCQKVVLVKLAALRWFWERPGDAKRFIKEISAQMEDADEWVRLEAVRTLGRIDRVDPAIATKVSVLLSDPDAEVRKAAAKTCGKLNCTDVAIVEALRQAAQDADTEVRWKAQKALRQLGVYTT